MSSEGLYPCQKGVSKGNQSVLRGEMNWYQEGMNDTKDEWDNKENVSMSREGINMCWEGEWTNMNWKVIVSYR